MNNKFIIKVQAMYNQGQVSCFLKVAELASFSLAAQTLHLTVTAVSKQIKNPAYAVD